jgi:hypothetical protein
MNKLANLFAESNQSANTKPISIPDIPGNYHYYYCYYYYYYHYHYYYSYPPRY